MAGAPYHTLAISSGPGGFQCRHRAYDSSDITRASEVRAEVQLSRSEQRFRARRQWSKTHWKNSRRARPRPSESPGFLHRSARMEKRSPHPRRVCPIPEGNIKISWRPRMIRLSASSSNTLRFGRIFLKRFPAAGADNGPISGNGIAVPHRTWPPHLPGSCGKPALTSITGKLRCEVR